MLQDRNAAATVAVRDLNVARSFYEGKLGLTALFEDPEVIVFKSGQSTINVYRSQYAGSNKATAVTWGVGSDMDDVVRDLKGKGIAFERYDMPGMKQEGDVYVDNGMKVAWFKDPDGNILNIVNQ
jgi:catechol 2,3-dioxygenase-like lactoylglutathione lyase family enzyme